MVFRDTYAFFTIPDYLLTFDDGDPKNPNTPSLSVNNGKKDPKLPHNPTYNNGDPKTPNNLWSLTSLYNRKLAL